MKRILVFVALGVTVGGAVAKPVSWCQDKIDGLYTIAIAKEVGVSEAQALQIAGRAVRNADLRSNYINGIKMLYENPVFKDSSADHIREITTQSCSK
jgi:hypothetical protein